ncbi:MAG TPA: hypothetical protein VGX23_18895 [Actinocrinis sp.]|nr:hypothetical protein [Actinocrinis sp.]
MAEEGTVDGLLWYARVAVVRALRAADGGDERAQDLTALAARACVAAADAAPGDPTPWTAMLALARLGHSAVPGPEGVDAKGPWDLAEQAQRRDPWNREAHLRLLACFYPRHGGSGAAMWEVADWASRTAPENSAVRLLPLWAYAEHYRSRSGAQAVNADRQWSTEFAEYRAMNLYDGWFLPTQRSAYYQQYVPVADYSLLAHALYAHGRRRREASVVLHAMGPYASSYPWSLFGDPAQQLVRARATCGLIPP